MRKLKILIRSICLLGVLFCIVGVTFYVQNDDKLSISYYACSSKKYLGNSDFKILQLSDLHNHPIRYSNASLTQEIESLEPDVIVCTGDFIDDHTRDYSELKELGECFERMNVSVFYVDGNHERKAPPSIVNEEHRIFADHHFKNLCGLRFDFKNGLVFSGLLDPGVNHRYGYDGTSGVGDIPEQLEALKKDFDGSKFNVMLCHRPDYFGLISDQGYDLTFSGHTHGGQILIGNWAVANLPWTKYIAGEYERNDKKLIVSRGLGIPIFCLVVIAALVN